jgi:hypothetical protein
VILWLGRAEENVWRVTVRYLDRLGPRGRWAMHQFFSCHLFDLADYIAGVRKATLSDRTFQFPGQILMLRAPCLRPYQRNFAALLEGCRVAEPHAD